jgi:hypothetical protein
MKWPSIVALIVSYSLKMSGAKDMNRELVRIPPKKQPGQGCGPRTIDGTALNVRSVSALLGAKEKHMRGLVARRLIPFRRLGGRIIFIRTEILAWLDAMAGCSLEEA